MKIITLFVFVLAAVSAAGKVFYAKAGQRAVLECGVNSFKSTVVWLHEENLIVSMDRKFSFPVKATGASDLAKRSRLREETNLQISGVTEGDAGRFSCKTDGNLNEHVLLVVSVSASPSDKLEPNMKATLRCNVKDLNPGPTVRWEGPTRSVNQHTVQISASSDAGTWVCVIIQDGIIHKENLTITVKEPVRTTLSPTQSPKNNHCPDCAKTPRVDQLSWWVWVAVAVGCLVMVLLMVCVIVLCKKVRRRKKKFLRMQNSQMGSKRYCQCNRPTAAARPQQGRRKEKPSALRMQPRAF